MAAGTECTVLMGKIECFKSQGGIIVITIIVDVSSD